MATPVAEVAHTVETATSFGTWTAAPHLEAISASEGAGQVVGEATLRQRYGKLRLPGATGQPQQVGLVDTLGQWVRITVASAAIWHGYVNADTNAEAGGENGEQALHCVGILGVLADIFISDGWEARFLDGGDSAMYVDSAPAVNRLSGGDMSPATYSINGRSVHVFCRTGEADVSDLIAQKWTARAYLDYVLAHHAQPYDPVADSWDGDLAWQIADPDNCLAYELPTTEYHGQRVLDVVNAIISARRGLTFFVSVSGAMATINVRSVAASAITSGGYTLPASSATATPDLSGIDAEDVSISHDLATEYDYIEVVGARPWVAMTLGFLDGATPAQALVKGWTAAQEAAFDSGSGVNPAVWRRFDIGRHWDGRQSGFVDVGLRWDLGVTAGAWDGSRQFGGTGPNRINPRALEFTRDLPCSEGFGNLRSGPRQLPIVIIGSDVVSGDDIFSVDPDKDSLQLEIADTPGAVIVGSPSDDRGILQGRLKSSSEPGFFPEDPPIITPGEQMLATVGIREPAPLKVAWRRASGQRRDVPRCMSVNLPECEQWLALKGTVTGVDGGTVQSLADDLTIRDDLPAMQQALALLRAYYAQPSVLLSYKLRGEIDATADTRPGTLVTSATLAGGDPGRVEDINAVITRRAWTFATGEIRTEITTERIIPDLEAIK